MSWASAAFYVRHQLRGPIVCVAAVIATLWMVSCHDGFGTIAPSPDSTAIVSDRVLDASLSTASVTEDVVFVSLPPGAIPLGGFATIHDSRTGSDASAAMAEGGFDPVPLRAVAGDTLAVNVRLVGGGNQLLYLVVPSSRRPVVVRTDPPPRKRDVPLNTSIVVVFSEPIRVTSGERIQVLHNGSPVNGSVVVTADGLRAEFQPAEPLSRNSDYVLSIPGNVTDLTGDEMGQQVTADFATGTTVIAASVATDPVATLMNPFV